MLLGDKKMPEKREIEGYVTVKHARYDKVDNKYDVTLNCQFMDKDRKIVVADNLNFSKMNPEQNQKLLKMLGVDDLNSFTPLFIKLVRPEDRLDEWDKLTETESEDRKKGGQDTLKDD